MSLEDIADRTLWYEDQFPKDRKNLVSALTVECEILTNDPARYPSVADSLQWVADEMHALKRANNALLLSFEGYAPICFSIRCGRIVTALQDQVRSLRGGPQNIAFVIEAIKMLIIQIGRLSLSRDGSDPFANEMDCQAEDMDDFWRERRPQTSGTHHGDRQAQLYDLWVYLNEQSKQCTCDQCTRRFLLYSEDESDLELEFP